MADVTVARNDDQHRYEAFVDGKLAGVAQFKLRPGEITVYHTEVQPEFEGKGVASVLAKRTLDDIRERGERLVAQCPFIASYITRHQEYQDLLVAS